MPMRIIVALFVMALSALAKGDESRAALALRSELVSLSVDLGGGSIKSFSLNQSELNPLSWDSSTMGGQPRLEPSTQPRPMGHFVCLDRWGPPSPVERQLGMPVHGEAAHVWWSVEEKDSLQATLSATLPLAGLKVERRIRLEGASPLFHVRERVTNTRHLGRIYNIVQHPTIGAPFLDEDLVVDCNGARGFMQNQAMPDPEAMEVQWPEGKRKDGTLVDVRRLKDDPSPNVVSYMVDDSELGWIAAYSPNAGQLLVYVWQRQDFPWINMWRHSVDGKPFARGLEFGTTGLHQPESVLAEKKEIFGEGLFRYLNAEETQEFSYAAFLSEVPKDFEGVASITRNEEGLSVLEKGIGRILNVKANGLFK